MQAWGGGPFEPDTPEESDTPDISDKTYVYTVSGAGEDTANGNYWETGDGAYTNGICTMFFEAGAGDWYLGSNLSAPFYYRIDNNPLGNWSVFKGTAPAPTVVEYAGGGGNAPDSPDNGDSVIYKVIDQYNGTRMNFADAVEGEYTEISATDLDALYPLWDGESNSNIKYYTNHANFRLFFNPDTNLCYLQYAYPQGERFQWEQVATTNAEGVNLPATGSWTDGFDVVVSTTQTI